MPIVVSLFSGAGGLDQGFRSAGYKIGCCVELEKWACDTLRRNHPDTPVMGPPLCNGDINSISAKDICDFAGLQLGDVDVLIGGPPCQPFSQAAAQRFLKEDERFKRQGFNDTLKGNLLFQYIRLVVEFQPRVFVLENVPGLKTIDNGIQLRKALEELHQYGYRMSLDEAINAVDYGIPQCRERLIIWGSRTIDNPTLPQATHTPKGYLFLPSYRVVAHSLVGMSQSLPNHVTREHTASSIERYRKLDFGEREKTGRVDRLNPTKPSKTVIAGGDSGGGRSHLHPFIGRTLTVRECARLQTFDDGYIFEGSISRQFTQVGNAVPPLLAEHIARHIKWQEFEEEVTEPLHHGQYLYHDKDIEALVEQLLDESRAIKPEWIYHTHAITADKDKAKILINEQMHFQINIESGQVVKVDVLTASEQRISELFEYIKAQNLSFKNIKSNRVAKIIVEYRNNKEIDSLNFLTKQRCGIGKAKISILSNFFTITSPQTIKNIDEVEQPRKTIQFGKSPTDENSKAIETKLAYVGKK